MGLLRLTWEASPELLTNRTRHMPNRAEHRVHTKRGRQADG